MIFFSFSFCPLVQTHGPSLLFHCVFFLPTPPPASFRFLFSKAPVLLGYAFPLLIRKVHGPPLFTFYHTASFGSHSMLLLGSPFSPSPLVDSFYPFFSCSCCRHHMGIPTIPVVFSLLKSSMYRSPLVWFWLPPILLIFSAFGELWSSSGPCLQVPPSKCSLFLMTRLQVMAAFSGPGLFKFF